MRQWYSFYFTLIQMTFSFPLMLFSDNQAWFTGSPPMQVHYSTFYFLFQGIKERKHDLIYCRTTCVFFFLFFFFLIGFSHHWGGICLTALYWHSSSSLRFVGNLFMRCLLKVLLQHLNNVDWPISGVCSHSVIDLLEWLESLACCTSKLQANFHRFKRLIVEFINS